MKRRISAFTYVELMVVLAISTIVIAIAMNVYLFTGNITSQLIEVNDSDYDTMLFYTLMKSDIHDCSRVKRIADKLILDKTTHDIYYDFGNNIILRMEKERVDTFFVSYNDLQMKKYQKLPSLVSEISFSVLHNKNKTLNFHFYKEYTRDVLFNTKVHKIKDY